MSEGSAELDHGRDRVGHRLLPLDGLRGLAALAVVIFHFLYNGPRVFPELGDRVDWTLPGEQGVRVFFVISGIVIMMSLRGSSPLRFARSRFTRLFPSYWIAILFTGTAVAVFGLPGQAVSARDFILNFTMIHTALGIKDVDPVYWTLAVELVFYVISAALWFLGALTPKRLPVVLYAWLVASAVLAFISDQLALQGPGGVFENMPWFLIGIVALRIVEGDRRASIIAFVPIALLSGIYFDWAAVLGAAAGFAIVLITLMWHPLGLDSAPLRALGWASYPLYLLHQNLGYISLLHLQDIGTPRWMAVSLTIAGALLLAFAFTKWVDVPLRRKVGQWLRPQNRPTTTVVAS
ncbi:acyltransferase [Curtobacterium sp. MCBD17_021]|uniref:acyltransferase family protein n=1 Tax=Curtobacterium sp. MCBD17_021 TaxID=2175665 RepID=UPI000DA97069|nr:acyltransferase [Curtobacterium sp. MCBD17_021]PZE66877.1 hypothetical protein DEI83_06095 [Curtobacterium sp. MCBD17_021]